MRISNNITALQAQTNIMRANRKSSLAMQRMSSGLRINSVKDDAAGLAIANKLRTQISGIQMASRNALDGISLVQTAEGGMNEMQAMMQRIRELAVEAANDTNEPDDRIKMQKEIDGLIEEMDSIVERTEFNNNRILNGSLSRSTKSLQGGARYDGVASGRYVSDGMPPGTLNYTIDSIGTPARLEGAVSGTDTFSGGSISINGARIDIEPGESMDSVLAKIRDAAFLSDIEVKTPNYPGSGPMVFLTEQIGKAAEINITGDSAILAQLGLTQTSAQGVDPSISGINFTDKAGNPINDLSGSNSVTYDGNKVSIKGNDGKEIVFELNFRVMDDGSFQLMDGTLIDDDGTLPGGSIAGMGLELSEFGPLTLQTGQNSNMEITINIPDLSAKSLGLHAINVKNPEGAGKAINLIDKAISDISDARSKMGAFQNRLEHTVAGLEATSFATENARSRIEDADMAMEMTNYTQLNVISQAGISILAQANQRPQQILSLLK